MKKNIAWAGGGTGGHVFPIKSLIEYINNNEKFSKEVNQMFWFGKKGNLEEETYKRLKSYVKNLTFLKITSGKRRREKSLNALLKNIKDLFLFSYGILQSLILLKKYHIDVIFCKGGYVALPVVFAAKILGKKIIMHESDVHPGLVNRIAYKYAKTSFTGFDNVFPNAITVGQILSEELLVNEYSKTKKETQVLVMGGSQGSKDLYEALAKILQNNKELENVHFDIVLGKLNRNLKNLFSNLKNVNCYDFLSQQEMGKFYTTADIAITRAGTTSLAEQQLFDLKLIMIPIPWTHDQKDNAKRYVKHNNGILLEQDDPLFLEKLEKALISLKSFKKIPSGKNKKEIITEAKEKIIQAIFYS